MDIKYLTRQLELLHPDKLNKGVTIIGAGATGSFIALSLAKMGFSSIEVYDNDEVSEENMNCQFYRLSDIGKKKVLALQELVKDFTGVEIKAIPYHWKGHRIDSEIVINGADSMQVRRELVEFLEFTNKLYIDPRIASEYCLIYSLHMMDSSAIHNHNKTLYSDTDAVQERCTAKALMYTPLLVAGLVCKMVKDYVIQIEKPLMTVQYSIKDNQALLFVKE